MILLLRLCVPGGFMLATVLGCVCLGIASLIYLSVSIMNSHSHQKFYYLVSSSNAVVISYVLPGLSLTVYQKLSMHYRVVQTAALDRFSNKEVKNSMIFVT